MATGTDDRSLVAAANNLVAHQPTTMAIIAQTARGIGEDLGHQERNTSQGDQGVRGEISR